ncbi:MAG: T9SS type A sorting domain-containing protein, partial [Candidatus Cloacimonetes bacterium]|nr:T9SS type A sorting domain-containing protein [Candidatus Cloacimonadota bacterium]
TDNDQIFPIAMKSWVIVQGSGIDTTTVIGEPHPLMYDNIVTLVFSIIMAPDVFLSDMSITSCNINHYCIAIGGDYRYSSVEFSHLRIYNIESSDSYTGNYEAVYFGATSERESLWENVTIENIGPARVQMITSSGGISETGEISAMKGRFSNCTFRNTLSTFQSSSVWGPPLISIKGNQRLEFENCVFENLSVADDDANVIQIGGIQYPQQQNHFSFKNSLFSNISSHDNMILIGSRNNPKIDITNCTFAGNQGDAYTLMVNGEVNIVNSIFDNDTPYQIKINPMDGNPNEHTNLTIDHSLVKDGISGILPFPVPGNTVNFLPSSISDNPLFTGGFDINDPLNYSLSALSPCINTGTLDTLGLFLPPYDLAGNWRIWNGRIDMGCFELGAPPVGNDDPSVPAVPAFSLTAYPNPFSAFTNIRAEIPARGDRGAEAINTARIVIYNLRGQMVRAMELDPGVRQQVLTWDGRDSRNQRCSNGIYFLNLVVDGRSIISKKVTLIR